MKNKIDEIIEMHILALSQLNTSDSNIPRIVKSIDSLTVHTYEQIYALRDGRKNGEYNLIYKK